LIRRKSAATRAVGAVVLAALAVGGAIGPARGGPAAGTDSSAASVATVLIPTDTGISADRILEDIKYLSSEELAGRGTGEPGCDAAARYIAAAFERAGLSPAGDEGGYLQKFQAVVGAAVGTGNALSVTVDGRTRDYQLDVDFRPLSFSRSGSAEGPAVFAGYGITAKRYGYDDYAGADVSGKVVIVMRHEPGERDPASPFDGESPTYYSDLKYKATNAREHGAAAMVLVTDPLNHEGEDSELLDFDARAGRVDAAIPCVQATLAAVEAIFESAGLDLEALQERIDSTFTAQTQPLEGVRISVTTSVERDVRTTYNVLGLLEGSDPAVRDSAVVVGAHYDHLGVVDGAIHPGADDNASGTAGLLEISRVLGARRDRPPRSVLFAAFSGEELGLLGSSFLAERLLPDSGSGGEPVGPGSEGRGPSVRPAAMVNMDMIGRLRGDKLMIGGIGTSPIFRPLLEELAKGRGFQLDYSAAGYGPSDHTPFYAKGVPVLFFFTGVHDDHHKPSDTWEKIDSEGEARVVSLVLAAVEALAGRREVIPFARARGEASPPGGERYGGYGRARLGIIPDFSGGDVEGVRISGASEGSPAAKAGLLAGDVIVSFDGRAVRSLQDLTYFLKDKKPGDAVIVVVRRAGEEVPIEVVLGERTGRGHK